MSDDMQSGGKLVDPQGRPIATGLSGKIAAKLSPVFKVFEGEVKWRFYNDRLWSEGRCAHCNNVVSVTLRYDDQKYAELKRWPEYRQQALEQLGEKFRREHQCSVLDDGKDSVHDFLSRRFH